MLCHCEPPPAAPALTQLCLELPGAASVPPRLRCHSPGMLQLPGNASQVPSTGWDGSGQLSGGRNCSGAAQCWLTLP